MTTISAKTILRSRHAQDEQLVLSTLLLKYPRCIHSEFMTHRVFSRNAASSRAIPVEKQIQAILDDPYVPLHWGANQKGMQATEECNAPVMLRYAGTDFLAYTREQAWIEARNRAIEIARAFAEAGYHKQLVNRIIEPFSHIMVLVSGTEWNNLLALRDHSDAEPHFGILAREIRRELDRTDNIQELNPGQWHTPFVSRPGPDRVATDDDIKMSVACCASTSYKTVDGYDMTMERAIALHDRLVGSTPLHASPCEHVAQVDRYITGGSSAYQPKNSGWDHPGEHGNFTGFRQYRKMLKNEAVPG
jgi:hypothetical protein